MKPFIKQAFVVSGAALNIAGHGCIHGYPSVLFAQLKSDGGPVVLTDHDVSWIASSAGIMGLIGNFISPVLMSKLGRQKTHIITTIPALLGWLIFFYANSVTLFLTARILHGLSLGLRNPLAAILVAEYTDPEYRGAFLGTFAVSLGLGIFLSHLWGAYLSWKMTALVCALFPLISMIIIFLSPESPSWMVSKGKFDAATKSFKWLRGDGKEHSEELSKMIETQKRDMVIKESKKGDVMVKKKVWKRMVGTVKFVLNIFKKKEFYKPAITAVAMLVIFEFGGAHTFPAYGSLILQSILDKSNPKDVNLQFSILDILRTVCAFLAIFLLKYINRRTILFTSGILTVISLTTISSFVYLRNAGVFQDSVLLDIVPMCLMVLYILSFCLGIIPLNWVICGEVFPLAYRSLGSTLSTSFLAPSFVVTMKTAPHLYSAIGVEGAFLVYAAILTVCLSIMYVLLPETKDKTLQEIEDSFKRKKNVDMEAEKRLVEFNVIYSK